MKNYLNVVIICVTAFVVSLLALSTYKNRNRANDLLLVTGLANREFESDLIVWKGSFSRTAMSLREANEQLRRDTAGVKEFIKKKGMRPEDFVFGAVSVEKLHETIYEKKDNTSRQVFKGYRLTQDIRVDSKDVNGVEAFSRSVTDLLQSQIEFISSSPEYYYTQLGKLKIEMIAAATKDGRERAEKIVESAGGKLGGLRYSALGVFQISAPNSNENVSWSGAFDTSSRKKNASVTIKLQFGLN